MKKVNYRAEIEKLYKKLSSILGKNEDGQSLLKNIGLMHNDHLEDEIADWKEDNNKFELEVEDLHKENEALFDKIDDLIDKTEQSEDSKSKLKKEIKRHRKEKAKLKSEKNGKARSKGIWEAKHDNLITDMENVHEICVYSRHTNIAILRRRIRQTVDEHIKFCDKCGEPKYRCHCESNKV